MPSRTTRCAGACDALPDPTGHSAKSNDNTVRLSNLSTEATEHDVQELCRSIGAVSRVHVAKDKHSGTARGTAFVTFYRRVDAERAVSELCGLGHDNLILHAEWASQAANVNTKPRGGAASDPYAHSAALGHRAQGLTRHKRCQICTKPLPESSERLCSVCAAPPAYRSSSNSSGSSDGCSERSWRSSSSSSGSSSSSSSGRGSSYRPPHSRRYESSSFGSSRYNDRYSSGRPGNHVRQRQQQQAEAQAEMVAQRACTGQLGSARIGSSRTDAPRPRTKAELKAAKKQAKLAAQEAAQQAMAELDMGGPAKSNAEPAAGMSGGSEAAVVATEPQTEVERIAAALLESAPAAEPKQGQQGQKSATWIRTAVAKAKKEHQLRVADAVALALTLAVGGASTGSQVLPRLRKCAPVIEALCDELEPQEVASAIINGAATASRFQQLSSSAGGSDGGGGGSTACQWLQLLFNDVDSLDEDGIADWWAVCDGNATAGDGQFAAELQGFLSWLEEAEIEEDDEP